jgi:Rieske 2Fe-2S family protein
MFDPNRILALLDQCERGRQQDRELAENNQRGVNSIGYIPGPYSSEAEDFTRGFVEWYKADARVAALACSARHP